MMAKAKRTAAPAPREFDPEFMADIGRKGGQAASGDSKRRSSEHYSAAAKARWDRYYSTHGKPKSGGSRKKKRA